MVPVTGLPGCRLRTLSFCLTCRSTVCYGCHGSPLPRTLVHTTHTCAGSSLDLFPLRLFVTARSRFHSDMPLAGGLHTAVATAPRTAHTRTLAPPLATGSASRCAPLPHHWRMRLHGLPFLQTHAPSFTGTAPFRRFWTFRRTRVYSRCLPHRSFMNALRHAPAHHLRVGFSSTDTCGTSDTAHYAHLHALRHTLVSAHTHDSPHHTFVDLTLHAPRTPTRVATLPHAGFFLPLPPLDTTSFAVLLSGSLPPGSPSSLPFHLGSLDISLSFPGPRCTPHVHHARHWFALSRRTTRIPRTGFFVLPGHQRHAFTIPARIFAVYTPGLRFAPARFLHTSSLTGSHHLDHGFIGCLLLPFYRFRRTTGWLYAYHRHTGLVHRRGSRRAPHHRTAAVALHCVSCRFTPRFSRLTRTCGSFTDSPHSVPSADVCPGHRTRTPEHILLHGPFALPRARFTATVYLHADLHAAFAAFSAPFTTDRLTVVHTPRGGLLVRRRFLRHGGACCAHVFLRHQDTLRILVYWFKRISPFFGSALRSAADRCRVSLLHDLRTRTRDYTLATPHYRYHTTPLPPHRLRSFCGHCTRLRSYVHHTFTLPPPPAHAWFTGSSFSGCAR